MEGLVVGGGTLVNVDDHRRFSFAAENSLEELGELTLSERDVAVLHSDQQQQQRTRGVSQCRSIYMIKGHVQPCNWRLKALQNPAKYTLYPTHCTGQSDCCAGQWCTSPKWAGSCLCSLPPSASLQTSWFCCIVPSQPGHTGKTWEMQFSQLFSALVVVSWCWSYRRSARLSSLSQSCPSLTGQLLDYEQVRKKNKTKIIVYTLMMRHLLWDPFNCAAVNLQ